METTVELADADAIGLMITKLDALKRARLSAANLTDDPDTIRLNTRLTLAAAAASNALHNLLVEAHVYGECDASQRVLGKLEGE